MVRNQPVLHIRDTNPCATLEEIGGMTGLSRQRVHRFCGRRAGRQLELRFSVLSAEPAELTSVPAEPNAGIALGNASLRLNICG